MKTFSAKSHEVTRDWYIVDAAGKVLGHVATEIARRLRGKHKPEFTPHVDTGDYIVVVNVDKLRVTGNKAKDKLYHRHSTYPGGLYTTSFRQTASRRSAGRTRTDGSSRLSHGRSEATGPVGSHISSRPISSSRSHTSEACQLA